MGYDMSIESPDPVMAKRKEELHVAIYGKDGLLTKVKVLDEAGEASPKKPGDAWDFFPFWEAYEDEGGSEEFHFHLAALKALYAEHGVAEAQTYYRLNIWGMGRCRDIMWDRGDMIHVLGDHPPFPEPASYGLDEWPESMQYDDEYNEIGPWPEDSPEGKFTAASNAVLSYSPPGVRGIPSWKLGSNDGWLVTEDDCKGALAALRDWAITETGSTDESVVRAKMIEPPLVRHEGKEVAVEWWPTWVDFLETASTHGGFRTY
jgi:hypothetical protein